MGSPSGIITQQAMFSLPSTNTPVTFGVPANMPNMSRPYSSGTLANQIDGIHCKSYSLAPSTPVTLSLAGLNDPNGNAITCTTGRVREFILQNTSGFPIVIGDAATNPWEAFISTSTGTVTVPPMGILQFSDPTSSGSGVGAVVTTSSYELLISGGTNAVTFSLLIGMCSAP